MSLRWKLWCGFGGLLLILLVVSVLTVVVLTRYSRSLERVFHENYESATYCDVMKASLDRLNIRAERLVWRDAEPAETIDSAIEQNQFESNLRMQLDNCTLPGERQCTEQLRDRWRAYQSLYGQLETSPDSRNLYRRELLPRYQALRALAQQLTDMNMSNMVSVDGQAKRTLLEVRNALLILVIVGTGLATLLVGTVAASILKPLGKLTQSARQIGAGNLELNVDVSSRDEIGQFADAFNAMASRLREFRRLDHDRLARTQQTTQLAIDSLPDAVFVIGPEGLIEISNRMALNHFGIAPGTTVEKLRLPWLNEIYDEVTRRGTAHDPPGYQSAIRLFHDGEERYLLPRAVPMLDSERRVIGATVILVDVTRLRHEDELKSGLVSTVSHELRTPLTSIRMAVLLMANTKFGPLTAKQSQLLSTAQVDSDRLYGIVENLLNLSRIESGRAQFQLQRMQPDDITTLAVAPMVDEFTRAGVRLHRREASGHIPEVMADPIFIGIVLTNLLSNALKFTPSGGEVWVGFELDGESVAFTVEDTGGGIPEHYSSRIFEKFFRIPRAQGPTGAGLGLAIARQVVEAHGGSIAYRPRTGGGSIFRFTLPAILKDAFVAIA